MGGGQVAAEEVEVLLMVARYDTDCWAKTISKKGQGGGDRPEELDKVAAVDVLKVKRRESSLWVHNREISSIHLSL